MIVHLPLSGGGDQEVEAMEKSCLCVPFFNAPSADDCRLFECRRVCELFGVYCSLRQWNLV